MELAACFLIIIILIRLKVPVGLTLLITSAFLTFLEFGLTSRFFEPFRQTLIDPRTWRLIGTIIMVVTLGDILSKRGFLERMVGALKSYISPRDVARVAPALIGLLPMPGGAMVSAPIVQELARGSSSSPSAKTASNFWWRHIWEPVWPLYQSVILAAAILDISVWRVAAICFPITIACIISGVLVISLPLGTKKSRELSIGYFLKEMLFSTWPVIFILITGIIFKLDLILSLLALYIMLLLIRIIDFKIILASFRRAFSFDIIMIFLGGLTMMEVIESGQAAIKTMTILQHWGIPIDLVVFSLPFLVGLLTGLTAAYVGVGFPIVSSAFALTGGLSSGVLLAYGGGLMGIMISPVHLCLVLTKKYFGANFRGTLKFLFPVVIITSVIVFVVKYLFYPG